MTKNTKTCKCAKKTIKTTKRRCSKKTKKLSFWAKVKKALGLG